MKYNIVINQKAIMENNLSIIEYAILDVISTAPTWCTDITINNIVYYWIARQKLAEELKSFNLKPDTVYRHLKKLTEKGFLNYTKHGKKDCINLTTKSKKMFSSTMSDTNPSYYVGSKSEKNSETNPTYNNTKEDNYTSIIKEKIDFSKHTNINQLACMEWIKYKRYKNKVGITKTLNFLNKYPMTTQQEIVDASIMNEYKGLYEPRYKPKQTLVEKNRETLKGYMQEFSNDSYIEAEEIQ